jgi:hypothetical protein
MKTIWRHFVRFTSADGKGSMARPRSNRDELRWRVAAALALAKDYEAFEVRTFFPEQGAGTFS